MEAKDCADIWWIAKNYSFQWEDVVEEARQKDLWVEPIEISKLVKSFPVKLLHSLKWVDPPDLEEAQRHFDVIAVDILKGAQNSLKSFND